MFDSAASLVLVAILWGATNPFIKIASKNIEKVSSESSSKFVIFFKELLHLFLNWRYMVPFLLNQCGSVLYVLCLQHNSFSLVVPVTNSLTFVFTALAGSLVGEEKPNKETVVGMALVLIGTTLCWLDKGSQELASTA